MNIIDVFEIIVNNLDELKEIDFFAELKNDIAYSSISYLEPLVTEIIKFYAVNLKFPDFNYIKVFSGDLIRENNTIFSMDLLTKALNMLHDEVRMAKAIEALTKKDELKALQILQVSNSNKNTLPITGLETAYEEYMENKKRPPGLKTGIPEVDNIYRALSKRSVTTIVAPPKNGKTTVAVSMLYYNLMNLPLNIIYIILEGSSLEIKQNLIAAHSKAMNMPLSAFRLKAMELTPEEELIMKEVAEDFERVKKGSYAILDPRHFSVITPLEMTKTLRNIKEAWGGQLDGVISDYIQLYKYYRIPGIIEEKAVINFWVRYWHDISIAEDFTKVLLSQMNREGEHMMISKGIVTSKALAEANELERSSARAFAVQSNPIMQQSHEMRIHYIYHRYGPLPSEFSTTYADFGHFQVGERSFSNVRTLSNVEELMENNIMFS